EGYDPPKDLRLEKFMVTPDPGVIEVNIHPAHSRKQLQQNTLDLYEIARKSRLGTEKFMVDGRHAGTGGGNHVTMGGATPADSPMLRRPDVLRSLITFWQHHPGLSYLFSGLFIGPTSQAPRVDEGRNENLYELEIAFGQMPEGDVVQPWLVDRLLRNLLVDISGNTHRSEFCIDKLYSPDSAAGRLGLLEFRAFEMPPHARMSLVQMLLLRTLVALFWKQPYRQRLVRWGTALHDRFLLPHYVMEDLNNVCEFMQQQGYPFQVEWLAPFLEFRFPHYGRVKIRDIEITLQTAIEPWHVMGEEVTRSGTARFVDSSIERMQVKVSGLSEGRYVLACNGRTVPLRNTGTHGEYVAGVRYRAWQPPSALHPTIGIHSPLVFDLIDTFNGRSIGGCTYHVHHAGGRSYDTFPVNAYEAEGRRISRFWGYGHTQGPLAVTPEVRPFLHSGDRFYPNGNPPGPMAPPPEETNREYPYTLDLRRPLRTP
ncbi:MAG: transglutaminase family protein, partial [Pseudomonadota bacterium]